MSIRFHTTTTINNYSRIPNKRLGEINRVVTQIEMSNKRVVVSNKRVVVSIDRIGAKIKLLDTTL